jgi:hypothetical protein
MALEERGKDENVHVLSRKREFVIIWYVERDGVKQAIFGNKILNM